MDNILKKGIWTQIEKTNPHFEELVASSSSSSTADDDESLKQEEDWDE